LDARVNIAYRVTRFSDDGEMGFAGEKPNNVDIHSELEIRKTGNKKDSIF